MSHDERGALKAEIARLRRRIDELERSRDAPSDAFFRSVLSAVPSFILRTDPELRIRYINRIQPGIREEDVLGAEIWAFIDPRYHEVARAAVTRARESGEPTRYEALAPGPNGTTRDYQITVAPVHEADGRTGICLAALDVSELVASQRALAENEAKLRLALDATKIGLWTFDLVGGEVTWDARMREICGRDDPLTLEAYLTQLVHPEDRAMVEEDARASMEVGRVVARPHRIVRADGQVRWQLTVGAVERDREGRPVRMIGGNLDVTEHRALEEQLRHAQKMEVVGGLTAGVAHNFNNMLAVIVPTLQLLEASVPSESRSLLAGAVEACDRATGMVRKLMTFAGQRVPGRRARCDVGALVVHLVGMCQRTFDRQIELTVDIDPGAPPIVCDAGDLEQVVMNLLVNARDAVLDVRGRAPRIHVEVSWTPATDDHAARVHVRVEDNGVGIEPSVQPRVFEPFFTTKDVGRGTGLGLATSFAIVRELGGGIELRSTPGEGTTFAVWLPAIEPLPEPPRREEAPDERHRSFHVLLVDDEEAVRRATRSVLARRGHHVVEAEDGATAVRAAERHPEIQVVLLDQSMPGGTGAAVVAQLRERLPTARILFFTGQDVAPEEAALVDGVLAKPLGYAELARAVEHAFE